MDISDIKKLNIPPKPGSYQFKNDKGEIIYVGKASNLKNRVFSYWHESANHSSAKAAMLKFIAKIEWIVTDSEIEALLLEANLIKKNRPYYNIIFRDDKRYIYIKISTEEEWPRIFLTRKVDKSGKYFGPFVSSEAVRETLQVVRKIWPYRTCRTLQKRACLYYRIGKCQGMCEEKVTREEYKKVIHQIILFLEGKKKKVVNDLELKIKKLKRESKKISDENEKEEILKKIELLGYQQKFLTRTLENANILSLGEKYAADVVELAKTLGLPKIPERIEGYDISNIFGRQAVGSMVVFSNGEPAKSEYRKFKIRIGEGNANDTGMLKEVLERRFKHGDSFDQQAQSGSEFDGEKRKVGWQMPDLIIVDGGKGQLNAVSGVLKKMKLNIMVISISKGEGLRSAMAPDKIFFAGEKKPLELPLASPALHVIKRVRDEAHRFAIEYHRKLRSKFDFRS